MAVEDEWGVDVPEADAVAGVTVSDWVALVRRLIKEQK